MAKNDHEVRDPIHAFVRLSSSERRVLDSRPFQRLRHINQLGLSHLLYPGATHKRFEHSLGVMELAGRVFDVVARRDVLNGEIGELSFPEIKHEKDLLYWRKALRMAALCHDLGHLPFSHTSEGLLPANWNHERLTGQIILSEEMKQIWDDLELEPRHVAKLAVGVKDAALIGLDELSTWEIILSEIIVGDALGVDRMDYLLRDSYHCGVMYGRFDHYRLIDTLRIMPAHLRDPKTSDKKGEPMLGVEEGGLHSAESLLLARYFMFSQVYCHHIRRIYDIHLTDFLREWLPEEFPTNLDEHYALTDIEVMAALRNAVDDECDVGHRHAARILKRQHFRVLYSRNPYDTDENPDSVSLVHEAACREFGEENVRVDTYEQKGSVLPDFPVLKLDGRIVSSVAESQTLGRLPLIATGDVFINPEYLEQAQKWLNENRESIISADEGEEDDS